MFAKTQYQTLFAYHWHTNQRLLESAAKLEESDYTGQPGYGHGSLHDLFFHLLRTLRAWRGALENDQEQGRLRPEDFPDLSSLRAGFAQEQGAWTAMLDRLSAEEIEGDVSVTRGGNTRVFPLWRAFQHLVLHGMQHHTEVAQLLTAKGESPGDLDFIFYTQ
jgi:uncharacterized damage-inducible protein DinB